MNYKRLILTAALFFVLTGSAWAQWSPLYGGRPFNCVIVSTAEVLTEITGCAVLGAAQSYYITSINWSSSIISTTTNYFLLRSGTGTACAGTTTSHFAGFSLAFTSNPHSMDTPIRVPLGHALCFIHPGAGTRNVNVQGFVAG